MGKQTEVWSWLDRGLWTGLGPSRRLRKLYRELADVEGRMAAARRVHYVPEHAPSDYRAMRAALRPLEEARERVIRRIDRVQNQAEEWMGRPSPRRVVTWE